MTMFPGLEQARHAFDQTMRDAGVYEAIAITLDLATFAMNMQELIGFQGHCPFCGSDHHDRSIAALRCPLARAADWKTRHWEPTSWVTTEKDEQ